jgi:hypothetical protein
MNEKKSSDSTKKWLVGCGIGCGVIIIILIVLGIGGYLFVKNMVDEFKDTEALMSAMTERYGRVKDYCPNTDGSISTDRIEVFLAAREAYAPVRTKLESSMKVLQERAGQDEVEVKKPKNIFQMLRLGFGLIPQIAEFIKSRNQALLDAGMGMGEYYYIYAVAYYSWLEKSPADGPDFQIVGSDERSDYREISEDVFEERRYFTLRRLNRMLLPMLKNQFDKLTGCEREHNQEQWRSTLEQEIEKMESDKLRLPWQDGLPEIAVSSLEPYRNRLEQSYNETTNPLEIAIEQR